MGWGGVPPPLPNEIGAGPAEALPPQQSQEVWKAFTQFCAPTHHSDFIRQALWLRLPVGECQKNWKPHEVWCPPDGELETMEHTLTQCSLSKVAFDTMSKCIPSAHGDDLPPALLKNSLAQSFQCPAGFLSWAAICANWRVMQKKKRCPQYTATWLRFVSLWIATLKVWASSPKRIPMAENELKLFIEALEKLMNDGVPLHPQIKATPPPPPPSKSQLQETTRQMCKQKRALELESIFNTLKAEGYALVFTDGSSVEVDGVGRVARYGIYAHPDAAHVPVTLGQTNNTAEL